MRDGAGNFREPGSDGMRATKLGSSRSKRREVNDREAHKIRWVVRKSNAFVIKVSRPFGTGKVVAAGCPNVETLGYSRLCLRHGKERDCGAGDGEHEHEHEHEHEGAGRARRRTRRTDSKFALAPLE